MMTSNAPSATLAELMILPPEVYQLIIDVISLDGEFVPVQTIPFCTFAGFVIVVEMA